MQLFLSILYLFISLALALVVTFSTTRLFIKAIRRKYQITPQNIAFSILLAAIIFSVGYIVSGVLEPFFKLVPIVRLIEKSPTDTFFSIAKYGAIFVLASFLVSFVVVSLGMYLFNLINTEIDELQEISKDNIAVGILVGAIIIVITLFVKGSIIFLLENLIPYPDLPIRT
ncbi:MAG: hypothetical protein OHK0045_09110 [Raineya sp.]